MRKIIVIIISILFVISIFVFIGLITVAYGSDQGYQICVSRCYLDLPNIKECINDEKTYWDSGNTSNLRIKRSCKEMIRYEKIDCRINCATAGIEIEDIAVKYYDTDVKNFPLTNE